MGPSRLNIGVDRMRAAADALYGAPQSRLKMTDSVACKNQFSAGAKSCG